MRSKYWVLASCLSAVAAAAAPAAFAATAATAGLAPAATTATAAPAAAQVLVPAGMETASVRPVTNTTPATMAAAVEPDPSQGPFPTSETLLLLAGLLAVGVIVRRRQ